MIRITIFRNGWTKDGKVLGVRDSDSLCDILASAGHKLNLKAQCLFSTQGGLIEEAELLRDGDVIYVSEGQDFISPHLPVATLPPVTANSDQDTHEDGSTHDHQEHSACHCSQASATHHSSHLCQSTCQTGDWLTLNVGGKLFTTTRSTLTRTDSHSMLARMFAEETDVAWHSSADETGAYLIDRSPAYFEPILNYLRHGRLILDKNVNPEGVLEEAKFFGLSSLIEVLEDMIDRETPADDNTSITRREFVLHLIATPANTELRCQGINFSGANLSKLDLRYVNFKYAILRYANLAGANLSYCNFERADLSKSMLDSANLLGVKMLCANLEGASLRGCNFEDPAGSRANMEGALMKNVDLEGSHMAGVNLRVATLKNANLQNCDLRGAVLAGADLENCDLSGCDLQEANLRGANLKGAAFELMLNPLHMAQTVR